MTQHADQALEALSAAVDRAQQRLEEVRTRMTFLQGERVKGRGYDEIVPEEERPLVVELLTEVLEELASSGAAFRRAEARVLHAGGMSHEAIARLFGVTRQRVGALLQDKA